MFFEIEEHHIKDGGVTIVNSMNVYEFNDDGKIRHLDVYLQGQLGPWRSRPPKKRRLTAAKSHSHCAVAVGLRSRSFRRASKGVTGSQETATGQCS